MWAVIPALQSQPVVELMPDHPSHVVVYGYPSDFGFVLYNYRVAWREDGPVTLTSPMAGISAVHAMLRMDSRSDLLFRLGGYSLRVFSDTTNDLGHPFIIPPQVYAESETSFLKAAIVDHGDGNQEIASIELPLIPYPNAFVYPNLSGLVVCFGYAYDTDSSQLKAYAHISSHRVTNDASMQFGIVPSCGSGTASLLVNIDEAKAFDGGMSLVSQGQGLPNAAVTSINAGVEFFHMACHFGPFLETLPHIQERWSVKSARAGTRVASLRSRSTNFTQPMATNASFGSIVRKEGVADVDCGGHAEFYRSSRFAVSLAGQPDADIAFVPQSTSYRSNCGFTTEQNARLASLEISANDLEIYNLFGGFWLAEVSFNSTECQSSSYGNNEYTGTIAQSGEVFGTEWDSLLVTARITGFEDVEDFAATPISAVVVNTRFIVTVSVCALAEGERTRQFDSISFPWIERAFTRTLTQEEADAFFDGNPIEMADGAITVTAVGGQ